jgi:transposase
MANRSKEAMDIREMIRMMRKNISHRQIAQMMKCSRNTVNRYAKLAAAQGWLAGDLPSLAQINQTLKQQKEKTGTTQVSKAAHYHDLIVKLRAQKVEVAALYDILDEKHGYAGSYSSLWRYIKKLEPDTPEVVARVEVKPGSEAQVDFGAAGRLRDPVTGQVRQAWLFVMTLSWSRHMYVEFVFDQSVATWLRCHQHAFEFFGGVPEKIIPDNLKAAIVKNCWTEPQAQRAYRDCALHYGFLIAPHRPRKPEHKGKVESGVHYAKRRLRPGKLKDQPVLPLDEANRKAEVWVLTKAGQRQHGTTKQRPLEQFAQVEQACLQALPATRYDPGVWKQVKLHRDCHVVFEKAYYSAPYAYVGQTVWVRGGLQNIQIYNNEHELLALHSRAPQAGARVTLLEHYPEEKRAGLRLTRQNAQAQADALGPATSQIVHALLAHRPEDRLRTAGRLLKLQEHFSTARLEAACQRALDYGTPTYTTVKTILEKELDPAPQPSIPAPPPAHRFVRSAQAFARQLKRVRPHG